MSDVLHPVDHDQQKGKFVMTKARARARAKARLAAKASRPAIKDDEMENKARANRAANPNPNTMRNVSGGGNFASAKAMRRGSQRSR